VDAVGTCGIAGFETRKIEFGTAVTPTFPRHPAALAQQAMTTAQACEGRFTLGIGLSHKMVIEGMYGLSYDRPAAHMREYLEIIAPLLRGEPANFEGTQLTGKLSLEIENDTQVPLLIAALGPVMLKMAGEMADGTTTWMTGPKTLESHIIPTISKAASEAGRSSPRIVCGLPIVVTDNVEDARERIAKELKMYGMLPSYKAMLDREGVSGPAELSLVGDEATLRSQLNRLRDIGVTDLNAAIISTDDHSLERSWQFLKSELN